MASPWSVLGLGLGFKASEAAHVGCSQYLISDLGVSSLGKGSCNGSYRVLLKGVEVPVALM